jgi:hypothetical protein
MSENGDAAAGDARAITEAIASVLVERGLVVQDGLSRARVLNVNEVGPLLGRNRAWIYDHAAELGAFAVRQRTQGPTRIRRTRHRALEARAPNPLARAEACATPTSITERRDDERHSADPVRAADQPVELGEYLREVTCAAEAEQLQGRDSQ